MTQEQRKKLEQAAKERATYQVTDHETGKRLEGWVDPDEYELFVEAAEWMEQNQWIPVTERLPESPFVGAIKTGLKPVTNGEDWDYGSYDYLTCKWDVYFEVTHWMDFKPALPYSPPKPQ